MEKNGKFRNIYNEYKIKSKCFPLLLWGTKITRIFVAISCSKTRKINKTGLSWTCFPWGQQAIWWIGHKNLEYFNGPLELKDKFEVIPIIITIFKKNYGLLGNYLLIINST